MLTNDNLDWFEGQIKTLKETLSTVTPAEIDNSYYYDGRQRDWLDSDYVGVLDDQMRKFLAFILRKEREIEREKRNVRERQEIQILKIIFDILVKRKFPEADKYDYVKIREGWTVHASWARIPPIP